MNTGAQKCVTQRVRNKAGSATSRGFMPAAPKKSRVWSSAITTMTRPRRRSTEARRARGAGRVTSTGGGRGVGGVRWSNATELMVLAFIGHHAGPLAAAGEADSYARLRRKAWRRPWRFSGDFLDMAPVPADSALFWRVNARSCMRLLPCLVVAGTIVAAWPAAAEGPESIAHLVGILAPEPGSKACYPRGSPPPAHASPP